MTAEPDDDAAAEARELFDRIDEQAAAMDGVPFRG